jgi:hypothetical protein
MTKVLRAPKDKNQALDDALYFLQAPRSTLRFETTFAYLENDEGMKAAYSKVLLPFSRMR